MLTICYFQACFHNVVAVVSETMGGDVGDLGDVARGVLLRDAAAARRGRGGRGRRSTCGQGQARAGFALNAIFHSQVFTCLNANIPYVLIAKLG